MWAFLKGSVQDFRSMQAELSKYSSISYVLMKKRMAKPYALYVYKPVII